MSFENINPSDLNQMLLFLRTNCTFLIIFFAMTFNQLVSRWF